jgi:hypothetical protein
MLAKLNCASTWAKQMAGRSAQNGGSCTATIDLRTPLTLSCS